jgi:hypothetical protein
MKLWTIKRIVTKVYMVEADTEEQAKNLICNDARSVVRDVKIVSEDISYVESIEIPR